MALRKEPRHPRPASSDDEDRLHRSAIRRDADAGMAAAGGRFGARGILDFAFGGAVGGGGGGGGRGDDDGDGVRELMGLSGGTEEAGAGGRGGSGASLGDEEGLGLLRQQLSAVQRIRIEHERKDATIAALRLEVSSLSRQREEMLALDRERTGEFLRLKRVEERCHRLEKGERAALVKARSEAAAAAAEARREEAARAEAEFRAGAMTERLSAELDGERARSKGLEEKLRTFEKELAAADRLISRVKSQEETNENLRAELATAGRRRSEAEHELSQLQVFRPLLERADSIDRSRLAAEEALRAATAELDREREASTAAKRDAAELRLALERRGARLAEAETEASKALSVERDLMSTAGRLEAAQAARDAAILAHRDAETGCRRAAAALDELAELACEALPLPLAVQPLSLPVAATARAAAVAAAEGATTRGGGAGLRVRRKGAAWVTAATAGAATGQGVT